MYATFRDELYPRGLQTMSEEAEQTVIEPTIQTTESETAPITAEPEKVEFSDDQQKVFNDMAAKKAFETREARRESDELRRQLEETKARIPQQVAPIVPDFPDPYDDDYVAKQAARDNAIRASAPFDANARAQQDNLQRTQEAAQQKAQDDENKRVATYAGRAKTLGMTKEQLLAAGNAVGQFGIDSQVANFIMQDDQGPLITKYLSENPLEMERLNSLDPMSAGIRIATEIKAKASALGIKQRNAPNPTETLRGSGVPAKDDGPDGATYE